MPNKKKYKSKHSKLSDLPKSSDSSNSSSESENIHRVNKRKSKKYCRIINESEKQCEILPKDLCSYMNNINTRFSDICDTYLSGLTIDDMKYLKPRDYINLVPQDKYKDKLLMTIMVRRYIY
jgi:hypothetical protein